jgi:arsenate reductase
VSKILFVCIGNSGRSVMAERLFQRAAEGRHEARSAGAQPDPPVDPTVVEALHEVGIDAADHVPRKLDHDAVEWADVVVAACDGACPVVPGKMYANWGLPDPKYQPIERVREIRDEIARRVDDLVAELG